MSVRDLRIHHWVGLLVLLVLGLVLGFRHSAGTSFHKNHAACDPLVQPLPAHIDRGMSYVHSWQRGGDVGYGSPTSQASLRELRDLGTSWISLMPFGFMGALSATSIRTLGRTGEGESDERLLRDTAVAHGLGMKVLLKPHVWIRHGEWCGQIEFKTAAGWDKWFDSYQEFLLHYAKLATEGQMDMLAIGVELCKSTATPERERRWRQLIAQVRQAYKGPLVYGANWDEVGRVPFWDAVDFIGTQFYPPLADGPDEPDEILRSRLREQLDRLGEVSRRVQRPVIFTEVGYKSMRGTAMEPHSWVQHLDRDQVVVSQEAQAQAYRVFFQGIRDRDFVRGVYPWKWFSDPASQEEGPEGFTLCGKLAETVVRSAYGGKCPGK